MDADVCVCARNDKCYSSENFKHVQKSFFFFDCGFNVPVNNFSVMLRRSHLFLGITSTFGEQMSLAQGNKHTDPAEDRTRVSRSGIRRSNH